MLTVAEWSFVLGCSELKFRRWAATKEILGLVGPGDAVFVRALAVREALATQSFVGLDETAN